MEIGPVHDKSSAQPSKREKAQPVDQPAGQGPQDKVELSLETNRQIRRAAEEVSSDNPAERNSDEREDKLALVKSRIETGYYARPEILAEIADRLIDELG